MSNEDVMQIPRPGGGNDANIFGSSELKNGLSAWPEFVRHRNHPLLLKDAKDVVEIMEREILKLTVSNIFNRPVVAGAVLQTPLSLIDSVSQSAFSSQSSIYHKSQTIRARELRECSPLTTCHMSCVTF